MSAGNAIKDPHFTRYKPFHNQNVITATRVLMFHLGGEMKWLNIPGGRIWALYPSKQIRFQFMERIKQRHKNHVSLLLGAFLLCGWGPSGPGRGEERTGCLPCCWLAGWALFWAALAIGRVWTACSTIGPLLDGRPWNPGAGTQWIHIKPNPNLLIKWRNWVKTLPQRGFEKVMLGSWCTETRIPSPRAAAYCWLSRELAASWL